VEREQIDDFVWSADDSRQQAVDDHWLVTLENESVVIGFLVPKIDEVPHVYSN
jgi:hypothetical protein